MIATFLYIIFTHTISLAETTTPPINLYITIDNTGSSLHNLTTSKSSSEMNHDAHAPQISSTFNTLHDTANRARQKYITPTLSAAQCHPLISCLCFATATWAITFLYCLYAEYCIAHLDWAYWHFNDLTHINHINSAEKKLLSTELLQDIQKKYFHYNKPTDPIAPLMAFLHDTDKELSQLANFIRLKIKLKKYYVYHLFTKQEEVLACAQKLHEHLSSIRAIFYEWFNVYKIEQEHT